MAKQWQMTNRRKALLATFPLIVLMGGQPSVASATPQASEVQPMLQTGPELEIPPVLYTSLTQQDMTYPTWVSAEAAVDAEGRLNEALFHPHNVLALEGLLTDSPMEDGCLHLDEVYEDVVNPPYRSSLTKAARASDLVVLATVVSRDYGFHFAEAGQLLLIEVEEALRGKPQRDDYFVFIPVGRFQAGPYPICKTDSRYPAPPDIGDELLVMVPEVETPEEPYLDLVWETSLVVIAESGQVRLPRPFSPQ